MGLLERCSRKTDTGQNKGVEMAKSNCLHCKVFQSFVSLTISYLYVQEEGTILSLMHGENHLNTKILACGIFNVNAFLIAHFVSRNQTFDSSTRNCKWVRRV